MANKDLYPGAKGGAGVYQTIINQIPPHKLYIELFLGSGQIIKYKRPAQINVGVEISPAVIDKYHYDSGKAGYTVINDDAISFIKKLNYNWHRSKKIIYDGWALDPKDIFIYADPCYPLSSRRNSKKLYKNEMTDRQHRHALKIFVAMTDLGVNIALSTYPNKLYSSILQQWRYIDYEVMTHAGKATERLYMNYSQPTELHDYQYLGKNFIDRQRIKRKIDRWVKKLKGLPILEQKAIMKKLI